MATSINVNKQSVLELLRTGKNQLFVIPEYQRPYAWSQDEVDQLFYDVWEFATSRGGTEREETYFLGTVVAYENEGQQEIIDGQQRITSLFLLLRAIYTKLASGDDKNNRKAQHYMREIEPAMWLTDKHEGNVFYDKILIESRVVDNEGNEVLRSILETGVADPKATDNYSVNYRRFQELYTQKCSESTFEVYNFIYALLNQCILMPITADSQDTALTIFSTLNDRGLPLSDADIFKAKIYDSLSDEDKKDFIAKWKSLEREAAEANESIQGLFYYYMFYLRAKEKDMNTSLPGVRKYYTSEKCKRLYEPELMDNLRVILNLWKVINTNQDILGETWDNNPKIRKALDALMAYPNEYRKYPVIIYYLCHRNNPDFKESFLKFIHKLSEELLTRYLISPTINAVKSDIIKLNAAIIEDAYPTFTFRSIDKKDLEGTIRTPHRSIVRMVLLIYAYKHQDELLPDNWQIEHILPRKWQDSFFVDVTEDEINKQIEHIGNKTPFERKLNIIASNGYFAKKQAAYADSKIEVTKMLTLNIESDWTLGNIKKRDDMVTQEIMELLNKWDEEYIAPVKSSTPNGPTEAELEQIRKFKEKGWI